MNIEEKRRMAFEAWFQSEMLPRITGSHAIVRAMCEKGWNAALDSVVIELPDPRCDSQESYMRRVEQAIESSGLKVKP